MVKADVRRDYYADLGLTPGADAEDIKKQFRKLALKYHPDRNPGKELEFNAKFQAIQAAHEILSDPQQRIKYDTDRLRNGYYGPKPGPARKEPTSGYSSTRPPSTKAPFSERPKSFHHGPSTGAQRYASYARAAPKQPWEKMRDETQTRADAYRGFQEMKGSAMPGWSSFDPRGRAGQPNTMPRPNPTTNGQSTRPKSAYEHLHTRTKPMGTESAKKKQGFAPRAAGGDEPMAAKTTSYRNAPRFDRGFAPAPSPTARKPAAGFQSPNDNLGTPEFERTSHKYATTGGEKTFFSSSMLGRSNSMRTSPKSPKQRPRTNPPSPTPEESGRHRSASPNLKADRGRNYSSTSSSDLDEEDVAFKPKAVPKSRLRPHQKFSNFHGTNGWSTKAAHDSDSASSGRHASDTPLFTTNGNIFDSVHAPGLQTGAFRSSSHDDLRKSSNRKDPFGQFTETQKSSDRGRKSTRNSPDSAGHSTGNNSKHESSRSQSASQQMPFVEESYLNNNWEAAFKFRDLSDALPNNDASQRQYPAATSQRTKSPRKQTRPTTRPKPTPQPASVSTEAEEAEATVNGQESSDAPTADTDGEAMDLDDELPSKTTGTTAESEKLSSNQGKRSATPKSRPTSKSGKTDKASNLLNLKILGGVFPLASTNNGGLDDLKDMYSTLPFESRAKAPKTATKDLHPRELVCPNPPKRPEPPPLVPISAGSQQTGISRAAWDRYIAEMNSYMREWRVFERRIIGHFVARQASFETEMAPNWLGAVGDSTRLCKDDGLGGNHGDESDDDEVTLGPAQKGFNSYQRALDEDDRVHKHWEVARERHRECVTKHGQMRQWALSGGKIF